MSGAYEGVMEWNGRHDRLRICCFCVWVQIPPPPLNAEVWNPRSHPQRAFYSNNVHYFINSRFCWFLVGWKTNICKVAQWVERRRVNPSRRRFESFLCSCMKNSISWDSLSGLSVRLKIWSVKVRHLLSALIGERARPPVRLNEFNQRRTVESDQKSWTIEASPSMPVWSNGISADC